MQSELLKNLKKENSFWHYPIQLANSTKEKEGDLYKLKLEFFIYCFSQLLSPWENLVLTPLAFKVWVESGMTQPNRIYLNPFHNESNIDTILNIDSAMNQLILIDSIDSELNQLNYLSHWDIPKLKREIIFITFIYIYNPKQRNLWKSKILSERKTSRLVRQRQRKKKSNDLFNRGPNSIRLRAFHQ